MIQFKEFGYSDSAFGSHFLSFWIFFGFVELENPFSEYKFFFDTRNDGGIRMNKNVSYFPCIKYKRPADPIFDGARSVFIAESMHFYGIESKIQLMQCNLSFGCANDERLFYKIMKDCSLLDIGYGL